MYTGLGCKKLSLLQCGNADDTHYEILDAFPKLQDAGGYEIMRASQSRQLEVVPNPVDGYTTAYLKDIFGQAKVYIRPIQRDLMDCTQDGNPVSNSVSIALDISVCNPVHYRLDQKTSVSGVGVKLPLQI